VSGEGGRDECGGEIGREEERASAADGHEFEEADVAAVVECEAGEAGEFVIVPTAEDDHVEFDREASGACGGDAIQDGLKLGAACDAGIDMGTQGVQAHVNAAEAGMRQCGGQGGQALAVGCECNIWDTGGCQGMNEGGQAFAQQGLTAGEMDFLDGGEALSGAHKPEELVE